jgi:pimeloyl-ACP methyl ester carboxylesterase
MASSIIARNSTNVRNLAVFAWHRASLALASALAPSHAVERAARLFTTPPRHAHPPRELALLASGTRFTVESPVGALAAWRFGDREHPVVLLSHGWGGRGGQWHAFVPVLLAAGFQPVVFDHAAHGFSTGPESSIIHFVKGLAAVAARLEADGARIAGVVGHSLGAAAVGKWLDETRRGTRAVLVAPPTSLLRFTAYFARRMGLPERVLHAMQRHFEQRLDMSWQSFELPQSIANARAPALVIHDRDDREVPLASGLALARAWPQASFVQTQGLGHRGILKDASVARDAADFIGGRTVFAPPPGRGDTRAFAAPAPLL